MESAIIDPTGIYIYSNIRAAKDHYKALRSSDILPDFFSIYENAETIRKHNPNMMARSIFNQSQFYYELQKIK